MNNVTAKYLSVKLALLAASVQVTASDQTDSLKIEEVLITSQKRTENIQESPISVTAIQGDALKDMQMFRANDIAAQTPNMISTMPYGESQPIFSLRGLSMVDYNANQASPIGIYVDESTVGVSFMQALHLFDIDRIEVLRGPQGTLYGKNTTGGAINFISRAPTFKRNGYINIAFGDNNYQHIDAAGETTLTDEFAIRAAATYSKSDGFFSNYYPEASDLSDTNNWAARISLRYQVDNFDAILRAQTGENKPRTTAVIAEGRGSNNYDIAGVMTGGVLPQRADNNYDAWEGSENKTEHYKSDTDSTSLTLKWDFGEHSLTSISSWAEGSMLNANGDGSPNRIIEVDWSSDVTQISQDLRLTSQSNTSLSSIFGFYYAKDDMDAFNQFDFLLFTEDLGVPFTPDLLSSGFTTAQHYRQERNSQALYTHLTYDLGESTTIFGGLRYTQDKGKLTDVYSWFGDYNRNKVADLIPPGQQELRYDDDEFSGSIGAEHTYRTGLMLYSSYSRGYRSSALNGGAQFGVNEITKTNPEIVDAYELGLKSQWFDQSLQLNAAIFYNDYQDQQFLNVIGIQQFLVNAGESTIKGAEIEITALPTEKLALSIGVGYLNTKYDRLELANPYTGAPENLSGNELIAAPELNINLSIDYQLLQANIGTLNLHIDSHFIDDQWFSPYNEQLGYDQIHAEAHSETNLKLIFNSTNKNYRASFWVKNIEENDEPTYAINLQGGFNFDYYSMPLPRRYGFDFSYHF